VGAQFKGLEHEIGEQPSALTIEFIELSRPLFDDFMPEFQGGLRVSPDGQLLEVRHPYWSADGSSDVSSRSQLLPLRVLIDNQQIVGIEWLGPPFDPANPSLGSESEFATMHGSEFYKILPLGTVAEYPDGTSEPVSQTGWDPEAVQTMAESKSGPVFGYGAHRSNVINSAYTNEVRLERHGLNHPGLSLYPEDYHRWDTWQAIYAKKMLSRMRNAREFGVMSDQLHVQILDPEAAQYALNEYQAVQAVIGLVTSAAPIRDGSFDMTIGEHYRINTPKQQKIEIARRAGDFPEPQLEEHDYLRHFADNVPYDWRELARILGSNASGAFERAAPTDLLTTLRMADRGLRDSSLVSTGRVFGQHTDRLRLDLGTIEILNMGPVGGNLYKKLAAQELVAKYMVALQLKYMQMTPAEREAEQATHQGAVEIGHINNILIALDGKDPDMRLRDRHLRLKTPQKMLQEMIALANTYSPLAVSGVSELELLETLSCQEPAFVTIDDTFAAYFQPNSHMTATDALRHAHKLEPKTPANQILQRFAEARRAHVYHVHEDANKYRISRRLVAAARFGQHLLSTTMRFVA
jgi:hypothetical protein